MRKDIYRYEVNIERKKQNDWMDAPYYWEVRVYRSTTVDNEDGTKTVEGEECVYELQKRAYARSVQRCKKKAIKHILSVDKEVNSGVTFGVVFSVKGSADDVVAILRQ
jgi:hypothetical protein